VSFPCQVMGLADDIYPMVVWRKNVRVLFAGNTQVRKDERFSLSQTHMSISEVKVGDDGEYICQVETDNESPPSVVHKLEILEPAKIVSKHGGGMIVVKEETTVILECEVAGNPRPKITWMKNNKKVKKSGKVKVTKARRGEKLKLKSVKREAAGQYSCLADNGLDVPDTANFSILVLYAPKVKTMSYDVHSGRNGRIVINCQINSEPQAKVTWFHNDLQLTSSLLTAMRSKGNRYSLMVEGQLEDVVGNYKCRAENRIGTAEQIVQVRPQPTVTIANVDNLGWGKYRITWNTSSHLPVDQVKIKYRKMQDSKSNATIDPWTMEDISVKYEKSQYYIELENLWGETTYEVSVSARNEVGWGLETVTLLKTEPQSPQEIQTLALQLSSGATQKNYPFTIVTLVVNFLLILGFW